MSLGHKPKLNTSGTIAGLRNEACKITIHGKTVDIQIHKYTVLSVNEYTPFEK